MGDMIETSRLTPRYIGAAYLEASPKLAASILAGAIYLTSPGVWPGAWAWLVIGPLIAVTILEPPLRWWTTRVTLEPHQLHVTTGVWTRRRRSLRWQRVGVVDARQSWAFRLCGVHSVTLAQAGDEDRKVQLWGIDRALRARIETLVAERVTTTEEAPAPHAAAAAAAPIFRARAHQLLLAGLVYGQFAVLGAAAEFSAWEVLDQLGLWDSLAQTASASPRVLAAAIGALILVGGLALTLLRFGGFTVERDADDAVTIRYGLLSSRTRTIDPHATVGLIVQRNLIEMALGRARLSLLTADSAAQLGTNLVLPSLPRAVVLDIVRTAFDGHESDDAFTMSSSGRASAHSALWLAGTGAVVAAAWWGAALLAWPPAVTLAATAAVAVVAWAAGRLLASRLTVGPQASHAVLSIQHVSEQRLQVAIPAVHVVDLTRVFAAPPLACVHYYAGMPRALRSLRFSRTDLDRLCTAIATPLTRSRERRAAA